MYPLSGWREPSGSAFAFVSAPWPRYITVFDVVANFFGYLPYGLLCALALVRRLTPLPAIVISTATGALLSLLL